MNNGRGLTGTPHHLNISVGVCARLWFFFFCNLISTRVAVENYITKNFPDRKSFVNGPRASSQRVVSLLQADAAQDGPSGIVGARRKTRLWVFKGSTDLEKQTFQSDE